MEIPSLEEQKKACLQWIEAIGETHELQLTEQERSHIKEIIDRIFSPSHKEFGKNDERYGDRLQEVYLELSDALEDPQRNEILMAAFNEKYKEVVGELDETIPREIESRFDHSKS